VAVSLLAFGWGPESVRMLPVRPALSDLETLAASSSAVVIIENGRATKPFPSNASSAMGPVHSPAEQPLRFHRKNTANNKTKHKTRTKNAKRKVLSRSLYGRHVCTTFLDPV